MAASGRRGRGVADPGRRCRRPRAATGSRRRARAPEPPRHQALHEYRPRAGAGRRRRDGRHLGARSTGRRHRDERSRNLGRLHREPPRRADARRTDRGRPRRGSRPPRAGAGRGRGRARRAGAPESTRRGGCSSSWVRDRTSGRRPRARSRCARRATSRPRGSRSSSSCTARSVALREGDTLVALNGNGPGEGRLLEIARLAEACGARVHTIAATYPPSCSRSSRSQRRCSASRSISPSRWGRTRTRSAATCRVGPKHSARSSSSPFFYPRRCMATSAIR